MRNPLQEKNWRRNPLPTAATFLLSVVAATCGVLYIEIVMGRFANGGKPSPAVPSVTPGHQTWAPTPPWRPDPANAAVVALQVDILSTPALPLGQYHWGHMLGGCEALGSTEPFRTLSHVDSPKACRVKCDAIARCRGVDVALRPFDGRCALHSDPRPRGVSQPAQTFNYDLTNGMFGICLDNEAGAGLRACQGEDCSLGEVTGYTYSCAALKHKGLCERHNFKLLALGYCLKTCFEKVGGKVGCLGVNLSTTVPRTLHYNFPTWVDEKRVCLLRPMGWAELAEMPSVRQSVAHEGNRDHPSAVYAKDVTAPLSERLAEPTPTPTTAQPTPSDTFENGTKIVKKWNPDTDLKEGMKKWVKFKYKIAQKMQQRMAERGDTRLGVWSPEHPDNAKDG